MKKLTNLISLSLFLFSLFLPADTVDEEQITLFQAGDAASADDVNQNFQVLIDAINNNAAKLQELNDNIAKLPAAFVHPQPTLSDNISGSSYKVFTHESGIGIESTTTLTGGSPIVRHTWQDLVHTVFSEASTVTLNSDGTFAIDFVGVERELLASTFAIHDVDSPDFAQIQSLDVRVVFDDLEADTIIGTWSLSGQELSVTFPADGEDGPETEILFVSPDGNVIMLGNQDKGTFGDTSLEVLRSTVVMGVRTHQPEPDVNIQIDNTGNSPDRIDALNNTTPFHVFKSPAGVLDTKRIYIENNGDANLEVTSIALIQEPGSGFGVEELVGTLTLAPGAEQSVEITSIVPPINFDATAAVYVFTDDPDSPTFIVQVRSETTSAQGS
jgi:hypothetical protein